MVNPFTKWVELSFQWELIVRKVWVISNPILLGVVPNSVFKPMFEQKYLAFSLKSRDRSVSSPVLKVDRLLLYAFVVIVYVAFVVIDHIVSIIYVANLV